MDRLAKAILDVTIWLLLLALVAMAAFSGALLFAALGLSPLLGGAGALAWSVVVIWALWRMVRT